jgi:hypothetical protein
MRAPLLSLFVATATLVGAAWAGGCAKPNLDEEADTTDAASRADTSTARPDSAMPFAPIEAGPVRPPADAGVEAGPDPCAAPNLIGCFTFEGTTAEDLSPTKLVPANVQGVTLGVGHTGKGLQVEPVTNIRFVSSPAFNVGTITVEAFIMVAALPAATQVIFDADARFAMSLAPNGDILCNATPNVVSGGKVATGRWVHVACVIGGGQVRVFIDGLLTSQAGGGTGGGSGQEGIAADAPTGSNRFVGNIDTLRVFNVARTAAEISADAK